MSSISIFLFHISHPHFAAFRISGNATNGSGWTWCKYRNTFYPFIRTYLYKPAKENWRGRWTPKPVRVDNQNNILQLYFTYSSSLRNILQQNSFHFIDHLHWYAFQFKSLFAVHGSCSWILPIHFEILLLLHFCDENVAKTTSCRPGRASSVNH